MRSKQKCKRYKYSEDVDDILHYIKALNYGMKRVEKDDFQWPSVFVRGLHKQLMDKARTTHYSDPGEFRKSQNWIGGTRPDNAHFVPPPVEEMHIALNDLENSCIPMIMFLPL